MPNNKTNPNTNTLILVSLIPLYAQQCAQAVLHLKTKTLPPAEY